MEAAGLLGYWWNQVSADSTYCLNKIQQEMSNTKKNEKESIKRLTLKVLVVHLSFLVLAIRSQSQLLLLKSSMAIVAIE